MDADLQNDPADIPKLIKKLEQGYDVVCGWRANRKDPIGKKIASKISNWLRRRLIKLNIHDSGCTLRAYRSIAVKNLQIFGETHRFIPIILAAKGFKVTEEVVNHRPRLYGKTKYGATRIIKGFLDLITLKFLTTYGARPVHIFGGIGIISGLLGVLSGFYLIYLKYLKDVTIANRPLLLLTILLILMGIQFLLIGFVAEMIVETGYKSKESYTIEKILN